jgi:hypothetical protein
MYVVRRGLGDRAVTWLSVGLIAAGSLWLGGCGDDGASEGDASSDEAGTSGDGEALVDVVAFCADAEALTAETQGALGDAPVGDDTEHLEDLEAMYEGMRDLEAPGDVAEEWDLYFTTGAEYFSTFLTLYEEGGMFDVDPDADPNPDAEAQDSSALSDATVEQEELLSVMNDDEVVTAETVVGDFLAESCDITL